MLKIYNLCKTKEQLHINHMNLDIDSGKLATIVANHEVNYLLIAMMLGLETPAKGEIYVNEVLFNPHKHHSFVGWVLQKSGFYERMHVDSYLDFFHHVFNSSKTSSKVLTDVGLQDVARTKIEMLSQSQLKRLHLARESLKDLKLLILQEPLNELNHVDSNYVVQHLNSLLNEGVAILCFCSSYHDAHQLGGDIYSFNDAGRLELDVDNANHDLVFQDETISPVSFKIEKIPSRMDDRIILFNPVDIDYVESELGVSYLHVKGERYACALTLKELEQRLQHLGFFMCHRSYLVNLQKIREINTWTRNSYSLILDDKKSSTLPLSKNRVDQLKSLMNL